MDTPTPEVPSAPEENPFTSVEKLVSTVSQKVREQFGETDTRNPNAVTPEEARFRVRKYGYQEDDIETVLLGGGGSHHIRTLMVIAKSEAAIVEHQAFTVLRELETLGQQNGWYYGKSGEVVIDL